MSTLRDAPATVPALGALALFVAWASDQSGYPLTHWAPGGLIMLALLAIAWSSLPLRRRDVPLAVQIALACLALYTALSFFSILWAAAPGDAWEGADRTLLYLLVFALFALWPRRGSSAALLLGAWAIAMIGLAAFVLLHLDTRASLTPFFRGGRLLYPGGYENASAATWAMVMWPALLLAAARPLPWALRGALAGGIVLLADLALLSQSRGALFATPAMLVLVFALYSSRVRTFAVLVPVAGGIGASVPAILRVGDRLKHGGDAVAAMHSATAMAFALALAVGVAVALGAAIDSSRPLSAVTVRRVRRALGAAALVALLAVVAGGWAAAGDPVARVRHAWSTFKSGRGYGANGSGNRLTSGLGSNRYDFYRVGLDEFAAHPLAGIGADNFQQQYLTHGRSYETPRYPHSLEVRTLTDTGVVGALLALVGLGAALLAAARAVRAAPGRAADPLARTVAAAAMGGFAYWMVHGSFDWFWEFAGLGAPAFALLGIACALTPATRKPSPTQTDLQVPATDTIPPPARPRFTRGSLVTAIAAVSVALLAAASLAAPWLSQREVQSAARIWRTSPFAAYKRLADAARLNPLSDEAYLVAGSIALRFGDFARADEEFSLALHRKPDDAYATLERGAIASEAGAAARALALLERAARLNPRDRLTRHALVLARRGRRVSVADLNSSIILAARRLE